MGRQQKGNEVKKKLFVYIHILTQEVELELKATTAKKNKQTDKQNEKRNYIDAFGLFFFLSCAPSLLPCVYKRSLDINTHKNLKQKQQQQQQKAFVLVLSYEV